MKSLRNFIFIQLFYFSLINCLCAQELILKNGDLYESTNHKKSVKKITNTHGKIDEFLMSKTKKYVAYSKIMKYEDEAGAWEEKDIIPKRPVYNIVVMDLSTKKIITEIPPQSPHDHFFYADAWVSDKYLLLHDSDSIAVSFFYVYDLTKNKISEIGYDEYEEMKKSSQ